MYLSIHAQHKPMHKFEKWFIISGDFFRPSVRPYKTKQTDQGVKPLFKLVLWLLLGRGSLYDSSLVRVLKIADFTSHPVFVFFLLSYLPLESEPDVVTPVLLPPFIFAISTEALSFFKKPKSGMVFVRIHKFTKIFTKTHGKKAGFASNNITKFKMSRSA